MSPADVAAAASSAALASRSLACFSAAVASATFLSAISSALPASSDNDLARAAVLFTAFSSGSGCVGMNRERASEVEVLQFFETPGRSLMSKLLSRESVSRVASPPDKAVLSTPSASSERAIESRESDLEHLLNAASSWSRIALWVSEREMDLSRLLMAASTAVVDGEVVPVLCAVGTVPSAGCACGGELTSGRRATLDRFSPKSVPSFSLTMTPSGGSTRFTLPSLPIAPVLVPEITFTAAPFFSSLVADVIEPAPGN